MLEIFGNVDEITAVEPDFYWQSLSFFVFGNVNKITAVEPDFYWQSLSFLFLILGKEPSE